MPSRASRPAGHVLRIAAGPDQIDIGAIRFRVEQRDISRARLPQIATENAVDWQKRNAFLAGSEASQDRADRVYGPAGLSNDMPSGAENKKQTKTVCYINFSCKDDGRPMNVVIIISIYENENAI